MSTKCEERPGASRAAEPSDTELVARCLDRGEDAWRSLRRRCAASIDAIPLRRGLRARGGL